MGAAKNFIWGLIWAAFTVGFYVLLPYFTLNAVSNIVVGHYGGFDYHRINLDNVLFFILSIGIINAGLAFGKGSSPKYSKRKACFSLLSFWGSGTYLYVIKFSGLSQLPIIVIGVGTLVVTFSVFVYMVAGIVVANAILAILDIFIAITEQHDGTVYSLDKARREEEATAIAEGGGDR